jgi:CheY-like chemotaxis protein
VDICLPDISGHEVARRLKADTSLLAPLLVALIGYGREHHRDVREAGFDHHFVKPADPATLRDLVWMSGGRQPNETSRHVRP